MIAAKVLAVLGFIAVCSASISVDYQQKRWDGLHGLNLCPTCVSFSEQTINSLLNIVLNAGVVEGCSEICGLLEQKTGSKALGVACNLICDVAGADAFVHLIEKADLDPIYYCELLTLCSINDNGDAKIMNMTVNPPSGPQGTEFVVVVTYKSKNGTGTGELSIDVDTVDDIPLGSTFLIQPQKAGMYQSSIKVNASPDPNCDPSQGPCEDWLPGNYTVNVAICNGECGSKHPHSEVYDTKSTFFTIN